MIFKFEPHYFERVWGGRALEEILSRKIPQKTKIGESWDLVDRKDFQSLEISPDHCCKTIRELLKHDHRGIMGPGWDQNRHFPILVKWLDCTDRLSLQVHPPSELADSLNGEPKTENWYIANAKEKAGLFVGLKKGKSKDDFLQALEVENLESVCHRIDSQVGDSILVESGRMHAIDAGNLILEIQQNSDTTFRVFDWGRKCINGLARELHIKESIQCIDFGDFEPAPIKDDKSPIQVLADCEHFRIRRFRGVKGQTLKLKDQREQCIILNPINIRLSVGVTQLSPGELGLSPYDSDCEVKFKDSGNLIVTDNFYNPRSIETNN